MTATKEITMITPKTKHDNCKVTVHLCKEDSVNYAALRCVDHNKHIQWLSKEDAQAIEALGI